MKRNVYLDNLPHREALERWLDLCRAEGVAFPLGAEQVAVGEASGRVTAEPLFAKVSSPPFHSSAMDGAAVRASDTHGASEARPVRLRHGADFEWVDTGEPLPEGYDAVIMIEDMNEVEGGLFEVVKPAAPWQHVRPLGEDIVATELVLPRCRRVRPADVGALLNAGHTRIPVIKKPVVAVIPTGSELVEEPGMLEAGRVMESNSWAVKAFVESLGGEAVRMGLVPDDYETIRRSVAEALGLADAVVVNAGTSAGREDYTKSVFEEFGSVAVHGVAIRPGKPTVLGAADGKPLLGLPGFPVAAYRAAEQFLRPLIMEFLSLVDVPPPSMKARLARKLFSTPGFDEFVQVKIGRIAGEAVAVPLPRGSGISMSLVRSDGAVRVPRESEGLGRGEEVEVMLYDRDLDTEGTILAVGSHDVSLDLLSSRIRRKDPRVNLASANVGSMAGIMAVGRCQAHVAGTHLLDPESGQFNVPYIRRHVGAGEPFLIHLAWREQGLMVRPGNTKRIKRIEDLARGDVLFANRQKGSGTRLLFDHLLAEAGVGAEDVPGYDRELFTHTAVAAAVAGGAADAGIGVLAAARALGLDFVPVGRERYDLLALSAFREHPGYPALLEALSDGDFRREVEALGGYDLSRAGEEIPVKEG